MFTPPPIEGLVVVDREEHLGAVAPDGTGDVAPQRQPVLEHAVAVAEELDGRHAHVRSTPPFLLLPEWPGGGRVEAVDAGFAAGGEDVDDLLALARPAGDGARGPVLQVVGVGDHRHRPGPVVGKGLELAVAHVSSLMSRRT